MKDKNQQPDVAYLQGLGPRNAEDQVAHEQLRKCEAWIIENWESQGYTVRLHDVSVFYPNRRNFLAFIGNLPSRAYVKQVTAGFKKGSSFPIEAGVAPEWVEGVTWSDHSSFWKFGHRGMQITDTGAFRSASHGTREDTTEKINFDALSRIVVGMYSVSIELTSLK